MLTRRLVLQSSPLAIAGAVVGGAGVAFSDAALPSEDGSELQGLIDMHCHVFNGSDLPIYGYLRQVIFKIWESEEVEVVAGTGDKLKIGGADECGEDASRWERWFGWASQPAKKGASAAAAKLCYSYIQTQARSAKAEFELLSSGAAPADLAGPPQRSAKDTIAAGLRNFFSQAPGDSASPSGEERQWSAEKRRSVAEDVEKGRQHLLQWLQQGDAPADSAASAQLGDADDLAERILKSDDFVSRQIRWVQILRADRLALAKLVTKTYAHAAKFALYAPAIIDYSNWLATPLIKESSLDEQGKVMAEVSKRLAREGRVRFHGYMAYDPLRDVVENGGALLTVQRAVREQGFLGAKLYPTMGFKPYANVNTNGLTFSRAVLEPKGGPTNTAPELAGKLDDRLKKFYEWCVKEDVPILTHATSSYGAGRNYVCRAHPAFWEPAFQNYPGLRVCLGHFGDFEEAVGDFRKPGGQDLSRTWEKHIARLSDNGSYKIYADVSYFGEILNADPDGDEVLRLKAALTALIGTHPNLPQRLLYGTDWLLLARERKAKDHFNVVYRFLLSVFKEVKDSKPGDWSRWLNSVFRDNAIEFLGLRNGGARRQLEKFYKDNNLDRTFLDQFGKLS